MKSQLKTQTINFQLSFWFFCWQMNVLRSEELNGIYWADRIYCCMYRLDRHLWRQFKLKKVHMWQKCTQLEPLNPTHNHISSVGRIIFFVSNWMNHVSKYQVFQCPSLWYCVWKPLSNGRMYGNYSSQRFHLRLNALPLANTKLSNSFQLNSLFYILHSNWYISIETAIKSGPEIYIRIDKCVISI